VSGCRQRSQPNTTMTLTLILTSIQPVSNWTHWTTLRRHSCLSRAASSQMNPIFRRSLLTTPLQFALGRPGPLLYPATSQYNACCDTFASHVWAKPAKSSFSQYVAHGLLPSSSSNLTFLILSFQQTASRPMLLCRHCMKSWQNYCFAQICTTTIKKENLGSTRVYNWCLHQGRYLEYVM